MRPHPARAVGLQTSRGRGRGRLPFEAGVTAMWRGRPNGPASARSNISAMQSAGSWASSPRTPAARGNNGKTSSSRGSHAGRAIRVNVAEVSLRLDNSDGTLPDRVPGVLVTRRLSRSGRASTSSIRSRCAAGHSGPVCAAPAWARDAAVVMEAKMIEALLSEKAGRAARPVRGGGPASGWYPTTQDQHRAAGSKTTARESSRGSKTWLARCRRRCGAWAPSAARRERYGTR